MAAAEKPLPLTARFPGPPPAVRSFEAALLPLAMIGTVLCSVYSGSVPAEAITGVAAWVCFYDLLKRRAYRHSAWLRGVTTEPDVVPPVFRADVATSIAHQCVVQGVVFAPMLLLLAAFSGKSGASTSDSLAAWWRGDWSKGPRVLVVLARHALYATFGYELKDLWVPGFCTLGNVGLIVHHIAVFAGVLVCLNIDGAVGLVVINACVAEVGSFFYNVLSLFPRRVALLWLYFVGMTLSNGFAVFAMVSILAIDGVSHGFKVAYAVLCVLIVVLRCIGMALEVKSRCSADGGVGNSSDDGAGDGEGARNNTENTTDDTITKEADHGVSHGTTGRAERDPADVAVSV
jgi:hypothetical protein